MTGEDERGQTGFPDLNPQFFVQFAHQGFFGPFPRLDLAAGKLPQTRQLFAFRPLGDQHSAIAVDKGRGRNQDRRDTHDR